MANNIEFKVSYHPSGNRTLMAKRESDATFFDVFTYDNEAKFYRTVAEHLGQMSLDGWTVKYRDTSE